MAPISPHSSFVYLVQNIPLWKEKVDVVSARIYMNRGGLQAEAPRALPHEEQDVVYYDHFIQEHLTDLVAEIVSGCNKLRRGNDALVAAQGFQRPKLSLAAATDYLSAEALQSVIAPRSTAAVSGRTLSTTTTTVSPEAPDHQSTFVAVNKELQFVQSLCQRAADQCLRRGACWKELKVIQQKLDEIRAQAITVAETLKLLENDQFHHSHLEPDPHSSNSSRTSWHNPQSSLCVVHHSGATTRGTRVSHATQRDLEETAFQGFCFSGLESPLNSHQAPLVTDAIEVDDDDNQDRIAWQI